MKKIIISLIVIFSLVIFVNQTYAITITATSSQTITPSPSGAPISDKLNQQINALKEKIASRVSELNLVEKRGIIGTFSEVSANQVTITDIQGQTRFIDVDEITKFTSSTAKGSFGLSDLTKGIKVSILGLYNKESKRILARFIDVSIDPTFVTGEITNLDKVNYTLILGTEDQKQSKIDIGTSTKISAYSTGSGIARYGFSKLNIGDRLGVIGYPDKKDSSLLVASRILDFTDLAKDPKISVNAPSPSLSTSATISPSITSTPRH